MCFHNGMTLKFKLDGPHGRSTDKAETLEILNELEQTFRVSCRHLIYRHQVFSLSPCHRCLLLGSCTFSCSLNIHADIFQVDLVCVHVFVPDS